MDPKSFKSVKTVNGHTYSYFCSPPSDDKPTLLLLHGFPDTAITSYSKQVPHFQSLGLGIIAPNILGYPGTSAPTDRSEYVGSKIATSILSILDEEKVGKAVVLGHDWGSIIATSLALLAPERVHAVVLTSVGASPAMSKKYDLEMVRQLTEQILGYATTGYVEYMVAEAEGAGLLKDKEAKESLMTLVYPEDGEIWKTNLMPPGKCHEWVAARRKVPIAPWVTEQDKEQFLSLDFSTVTQYYAAMLHNDLSGDTLSNEALQKAIKPPVLLLLGTRDAASHPMFFKGEALKAYGDVQVEELDAGHWMIREKEEEWRGHVEKFLKSKGLL